MIFIIRQTQRLVVHLKNLSMAHFREKNELEESVNSAIGSKLSRKLDN